jgi:hypothetical protein
LTQALSKKVFRNARVGKGPFHCSRTDDGKTRICIDPNEHSVGFERGREVAGKVIAAIARLAA